MMTSLLIILFLLVLVLLLRLRLRLLLLLIFSSSSFSSSSSSSPYPPPPYYLLPFSATGFYMLQASFELMIGPTSTSQVLELYSLVCQLQSLCFCFLIETESLYLHSLCCPKIYYVDQAGLELT